MALMISCRVLVMIRGPPAAPTDRKGLPSFMTMEGDMLDRGVLPGRTALAIP